jgi:hypothetical protein
MTTTSSLMLMTLPAFSPRNLSWACAASLPQQLGLLALMPL